MGAELKLQRKVEKLERILAGLSGVGGVNNIVSRQGRKIKQLQLEKFLRGKSGVAVDSH